MNTYDAMMRANPGGMGDGRPGMEGTMDPTMVHHEGHPMTKHLQDGINEMDGVLDTLPQGAPEYDEVLRMRSQLSQKLANISAAHEGLAGRQRGMDATRKGQGILTDPSVEMLERGITPGRR